MIYREDYESASDYIEAVLAARKRRIRITVLTVVLVIAALLLFLYEYYKVRNVTVEGSTRYTDEEIVGYVCKGFLGDNSLALSIRYRNREMPQIPFVETMSVDIVNHDTIKITVYEKAIAGYVDYLGQYMYFSRDGTVIESSSERLSDVPEVVGLTFSHVLLYQKLPVDDDSIFQRILNCTQLLTKYQIQADKIYFDHSGNMTVFFGSVRAVLGEDEYMDEKLSTISRILPELTGRSGTLEMSQYTPNTDFVTFVAAKDDAAAGSETSDSTGTEEKVPVVVPEGADAAAQAAAASTEEPGSDTAPSGITITDGDATPSGSLVEDIPGSTEAAEESADASTDGTAASTGATWESVPSKEAASTAASVQQGTEAVTP
ncbi:MAG: cell division protein FtsQ/DivIB [Lachnospiraceae bacterium]